MNRRNTRNFSRHRGGVWKKSLSAYKRFVKRGKIGPKLLLRTNHNTRFRLAPKSITLDDLEGSLMHSVSKHLRHGVVSYIFLVFTFNLLFGNK